MKKNRHALVLNDITIIPPPCLTHETAAWVYDDAFRRAVQYVEQSKVEGDVLEFGTFHGYTARTLVELMAEYGSVKELRLYDSWEGFPEMAGNDKECPEVIGGAWKKGDCNPVIQGADKIIEFVLNLILPGKVKTFKGFYENTLAIEGGLPDKAALVHIDCDLYESTKTVLGALVKKSAVGQGTVILFDDWNNNLASNEYGERKAVKDIFPAIERFENGKDRGVDCVWSLEPWFSYGSSGMAFIMQKS